MLAEQGIERRAPDALNGLRGQIDGDDHLRDDGSALHARGAHFQAGKRAEEHLCRLKAHSEDQHVLSSCVVQSWFSAPPLRGGTATAISGLRLG